MIKLSRPQEPQILQSNKSSWTSELITAIATYKGYSNIPNSEKERIFAKYNHPAIKSVLFASSNLKCGFCECIPSDGGNIEIEHFYPKSRYPNLTFEWGNYLPACRKCNGTKLSHDTGIEPLIWVNVRLNSLPIATCAVIVLIFFLIGYLQSRSELDHGTTVRFFRSTHGVTAKTVTAMLTSAQSTAGDMGAPA